MIKPLVALLALTTLTALSTQANSTTLNYSMLYDGTTITLAPGSTIPAGSVFFAGDSYNLNLKATGSQFWHVSANFNVFVPLSFLVEEFAARTVDVSTTFLNDGVVVNTIIDNAIDQSFIHIGSQYWSFAAGLDFDEIALTWSLLNINTGGPTTIHNDPGFFNGFGQNDAPFVKSNNITYIDPNVSVVPVPAALPLLATALAGLAGVASRRRKKRKA